MILGCFEEPGTHFGDPGPHFEDFFDFCDFEDTSGAKVPPLSGQNVITNPLFAV